MDPYQPTEKCREVFALLSDYLNLELPPDTCKAIEDHLNGCAPCIELTETLGRTVDLCRQFELSEFPKPLQEQARKELLDAYKKMLGARRT